MEPVQEGAAGASLQCAQGRDKVFSDGSGPTAAGNTEQVEVLQEVCVSAGESPLDATPNAALLPHAAQLESQTSYSA